MNKVQMDQGSRADVSQATSVWDTNYKFAINLKMLGPDLEYLNRMHPRYRFHSDWPQGLLMHYAYMIEGGVYSGGVWNTIDGMNKFFGERVFGELTDSVHDLGTPHPGDLAAEYGFARGDVVALAISSECAAFSDIGADADGSAVHALGTDPVATVFEYDEAEAPRVVAALQERGYEQALPSGLLMVLVETHDNRTFETQLWISAEHALAAMPGVELHDAVRISFDSKELAGVLDRG